MSLSGSLVTMSLFSSNSYFTDESWAPSTSSLTDCYTHGVRMYTITFHSSPTDRRPCSQRQLDRQTETIPASLEEEEKEEKEEEERALSLTTPAAAAATPTDGRPECRTAC